MAASSINSHIPRLQHHEWQLFLIQGGSCHTPCGQDSDSPRVILWEEISNLPRACLSLREDKAAGKTTAGTEICKDEKRKGGAEPFSLIHSLQLSTQSVPSLVSFPWLERTWKRLSNNTGYSSSFSMSFWSFYYVPGSTSYWGYDNEPDRQSSCHWRV